MKIHCASILVIKSNSMWERQYNRDEKLNFQQRRAFTSLRALGREFELEDPSVNFRLNNVTINN